MVFIDTNMVVWDDDVKWLNNFVDLLPEFEVVFDIKEVYVTIGGSSILILHNGTPVGTVQENADALCLL